MNMRVATLAATAPLVCTLLVGCDDDTPIGPDQTTAAATGTGGSSTSQGAAAGGAGDCGTCTIPSTLKVVTADTDPAQAVGGMKNLTTNASGDLLTTKLADGPLVLTDFRAVDFGTGAAPAAHAWVYAVDANQSCGSNPSGASDDALVASGSLAAVTHWRFFAYLVTGLIANQSALGGFDSIHGARFFVPAGAKLCAAGDHFISWSAYIPFS